MSSRTLCEGSLKKQILRHAQYGISRCNDSANERNTNLFANFTATAAYLRIQNAMIVQMSETQTCLQVSQRMQPIFAIKLQKYTFFLK